MNWTSANCPCSVGCPLTWDEQFSEQHASIETFWSERIVLSPFLNKIKPSNHISLIRYYKRSRKYLFTRRSSLYLLLRHSILPTYLLFSPCIKTVFQINSIFISFLRIFWFIKKWIFDEFNLFITLKFSDCIWCLFQSWNQMMAIKMVDSLKMVWILSFIALH